MTTTETPLDYFKNEMVALNKPVFFYKYIMYKQ